MKEFNINNVDRSNWKKFRFEEIAYSISERVEPKDTDLETYVGLEHLDPETIHIKRTGTPADVEGTKLKVCKGDIIFGRRRAYQRKAAIADFDGICSAHALVLRTNEKVIDPKLFPFFLHSDYFMHRAIDISVGSLSPTINWGTLKTQEFLLPPKEQQAELAELLWASDHVIEKYEEFFFRSNFTRETYLRQISFKTNERVLLGELGEVSYGMGVPPKPTANGTPIIRATNIHQGEIFEKELLRANPEDITEGKRVFLEEGDILVVRSGAYTGDIGYINIRWAGALAGYDLVFKPNKKLVNPYYLKEILLTPSIQSYFKNESTRSAQPHLNAEQLKKTLLPRIDLASQNKYAAKIENINQLKKGISTQKNELFQIQKQLINQIFST